MCQVHGVSGASFFSVLGSSGRSRRRLVFDSRETLAPPVDDREAGASVAPRLELPGDDALRSGSCRGEDVRVRGVGGA